MHFSSPLQDHPIVSPEDDKLDRSAFIEGLARALVSDRLDKDGKLIGRSATGHVVGLTGAWGAGKSSVLNLLAKRLDEQDHVIVAVFNPWIFSGRDELISGFFNTLRTAMGRSNTEEARALVEAVDRYWGGINFAGHAIAAVADIKGGMGVFSTFWKSWSAKFQGLFKIQPSSPEQEKRALENKLEKEHCAVVVLIDELDRVEDSEIRAVAQLVKAIGDIRGISYLVAYDHDRVAAALVQGRIDGERYLEKIIQHPIPIRPLLADDVRILFQGATREQKPVIGEPQTDNQKKILDHLVREAVTPRDVKRLLGTYVILEEVVRSEICPFDILAYSWIVTKAPTLRDAIANNIDRLVIDPSEQGMAELVSRRMDGESVRDFVELLGPSANAYTSTLSLLFPHVVEDAVSPEHGDRLLKRRNLLRMLYLGDPPGSIRRADIESIWATLDAAALEDQLQRRLNEGNLDVLLDRLGDLLPALPESGDRAFWPLLSKVLVRETDWISGPESRHRLADDAATTLYTLGQRNKKRVPRVSAVVETLIATGDLVLVPWILRKHLFAHGMTASGQSARGDGLFDKATTIRLLERELPRYRNAVLDGSALRRLPTGEVLYMLKNAGKWDAKLRAALTEQLEDVSALSTFAALTVPPGYGAERKTMNEFFDADKVLSHIESVNSDGRTPSDPWLAECLSRLRNVLSRGDVDLYE